MYFGADYYPEHWPKEWWPESARLMKEANINIVRLAEFAWAKLEPSEGRYDFTWLDEAMETLGKQGIKAVLGTPTATPPKWLMDRRPDIYRTDRYGKSRGFGSRRHYCYNHPAYHAYTKKIVQAMAEHYKDHPGVVAWQIDNEFGCHDTTECFCEYCLAAFKNWLKNKYGTLEALNREWGTIFWSQTYGSWDELILPAYTVCEGKHGHDSGHSPGMMLDFSRFSSDSAVAYQKLQIDEIRKHASQPITHNMMGHFSDIDYFNLGKDLDFVSWDNYPSYQWGKNSHMSVSMAHDLMRGVKNKNFWVMEQQSGPCGWSKLGDTPKPGQLRLWTYQAVAHGAEAILYFRWRACCFGAEEYWYGILDHDGIPRRRYREIQQTGKELAALSEYIVGSEVIADAALIKSYDNVWSHGYQSHNAGFSYNGLLLHYYSALAANHIHPDVTSADADLSRYKLVLMPAFNLMNEALENKLEAYVKQGGNLVVTFRSGTRTWNNAMATVTLPGYFKELAGVEVEEFDSLNHGRRVGVTGHTGEGTASVWCDVLQPIHAEVIAVYSGEFYKGRAAVTVHSYGKGKVFYIGSDLDQPALTALLRYISGESGIPRLFPWSVEGVEVVKKEKDGRPYWMLLNHNDTQAALDIGGKYTELITGITIDRRITLQPYGVAALQAKK